MAWLGEQFRRFRFWLRRDAMQRELEEEMAAHRAWKEQRLREAGLPELAARDAARRRFGNTTLLLEKSRAEWGWPWLDVTLQDVRYAMRHMRRSPGFTLVAGLTLAAGIGANSAVFTLFNAFVNKPLPAPAPDELVHVKRVDAQHRRQNLLSYVEFQELRQGNQTLSGLAAYNKLALRPDTLQDAMPLAMTEYLGGLLVTGDYFHVLGAKPALGRLFTTAEDRVPGGHPVAVLGWRYWQRAYAGDQTILGRVIRLQGRPFTVIGVTERGFTGPDPVAPEVYLPLLMRDTLLGPGSWGYGTWRTRREERSVLLLGRLKPAVTREQAEADLQGIAAGWPVAAHGEASRVAVRSAATLIDLEPDFLPLLIPITVALGLVLLLCCANVANLFLARAIARRREIAVRLSLGAHRGRVVRQLLTESMLLGLWGGALGLLLAVLLVKGLTPVVLAQIPPIWRNTFQADFSLDGRVFAWTAGLSLLAGVLFGLAPALESARQGVSGALKNDGSLLGEKVSSQRLRSGLLVVQVAVSLVLLVSAGLLVRALQQLARLDPGFRTAGTASVALSLEGANEPDREAALRWQLAERLRLMPGVETSIAWQPLLSGRPRVLQARLADGRAREVYGNLVSAGHFQTLGLPLLRGRLFRRDEADAQAPVVVVTASTARQLWPGEEPLGKQLRVGSIGSSEVPERVVTVVGIVGDTRSGLIWHPDTLYCYLPLARSDTRHAYLFVHAATTGQAIAAVAREAGKLDPRLALTAVSLQTALHTQLLPFQACAALASLLGLVALAVATVGMYGVVSYMARYRTRELGIRVALGATRTQVTALVVRQGLPMVGLGCVLGLLGGAAASRLFRAALAVTSPFDPAVYAGVGALLGLAALAALYLPAHRAARLEPMNALRQE